MPHPSNHKSPLDAALIRERAAEVWKLASPCHLCPRACGAKRWEDEKGFCGVGRLALVSSAFPHHGEEDCLRGIRGSGTIFLSGCALACIFCQNYELSHYHEGREETAEAIAAMMMQLQESGCHNINWVTPTNVVPHLLDALALSAERGLRLPIVYNSGGYDAVETLRLLDGIVDIYMPDFKYGSSEIAERLSDCANYPGTARNAVREMYRQVGDLKLDEDGFAYRGILIRHLVLPSGLAGTPEVMSFLALEISPHTFVNLMGQYRPCFRSDEEPLLRRPITSREWLEAGDAAYAAGLYRFDQKNLPFY